MACEGDAEAGAEVAEVDANSSDKRSRRFLLSIRLRT